MFESSKKSIYLVSKGRRLDSLERSWNQDKSGKVKGSQCRGPKWAVAIWHPKNIYCCRKVLKTRLDKTEALSPWKWSWKWDKLTESRYMQWWMQRNQVHSIVRYRPSTMHGEVVRFLWNFESQKHAALISLWCCTQSYRVESTSIRIDPVSCAKESKFDEMEKSLRVSYDHGVDS